MLSRQTLRRLANANSFERGQAYYDTGAVRKLCQEADAFRAQVKGTRTYHTELRLAAGEPRFGCNCPYAFDGICKHAVALGLAVLATYGPHLAQQPAEATPEPLAAAVAAAWQARTPASKLRFLEQALTRSDDLARQFLGFEGAAPPPAARLPALDTLAGRLTDTLGMLEFDEELWESASADAGGYYDEGAALDAAATEVLHGALAGFGAELLGLARAGQLTGSLRYWATACAAIYQVEEPGSDEYGLFDDYGAHVLHQWHQQLHTAGWPAVLLTAVVPPAELTAALHWLSTYLADPPARWPDFEQSWLPLLLALAADAVAAPALAAALPLPLGAAAHARLRLLLARTQGHDADWVQAAEILLPHDTAVARQLLHYYAGPAHRPALLAAATVAFTTWPEQFADYVLDAFTADQAPGLYRDALYYRALANGSADDYARLRPLLTTAQATAFVETAVAAARSGREGVGLAVALLAGEATPAALREFVLALEWLHVSPPYHAEIALMRLAELDPTPLMLELEARTRAYLHGRAGARRGALLYDRLGRWLASVRGAAPRLTEPVLRLALELRQEFGTLHGLRDALRREGLLPPGQPAPKAPGRRGR